jgi:hypothetical protein
MNRKYLAVIGAVVALGAAGGATALATGGGSSQKADAPDAQPEQSVKSSSADQARAAALRYTHGGSAGIVEAETEYGASWGVEVTTPDGSPVDVFLDGGYNLVKITSNADG